MLSGNSDFENNLLIEHASDATVFKEFRCGIKKMDDFIHEGLDFVYSALKITAVALEVVSFMRYNQQIVKGLLTIFNRFGRATCSGIGRKGCRFLFGPGHRR